MKDTFSEYYKIDDPEIKKHWQQDIFSFDANVLLNLYRYTPKTRDSFFTLLEKLKHRVWISYQAAFEYQKNRLKVISNQQEAYDEIRRLLEKKKGEIEAKLNDFKRHPYLKTEELKTQIHSAFDSINKDIQRLEKGHPNYLEKDPIWEKLTELLSGKIGDDFAHEELEKVFRDGKKRYDEDIPPGYMDKVSKKDSGNRSLYGDVIVWKQVLKYAKEIEASIIFVTDDRKDDWWYKFQGRTLGPRPELLKEFKDETGKRVNIYQADNFLELASRNLDAKLDQEAVDEIREIRLSDELQAALAITVIKAIEGALDKDKLEKNEESSFETAIRTNLEQEKKKTTN